MLEWAGYQSGATRDIASKRMYALLPVLLLVSISSTPSYLPLWYWWSFAAFVLHLGKRYCDPTTPAEFEHAAWQNLYAKHNFDEIWSACLSALAWLDIPGTDLPQSSHGECME
jgi:hypothetical protein